MSEDYVHKKLSVTERMREVLKPKGTANISSLYIDSNRFLDYDFILKCIDELDNMQFRIALGDMPNNLEKLAYILLCDSAYIETK